jgi:hypothetical protein
MRRLLYQIILLADDNPSFWDKILYTINLLIKLSPIPYLLINFGLWFTNNREFAHGLLGSLIINMIVGVVFHLKMKTFSWEQFWLSNGAMWLICISVYWILESWVAVLGAGVISETFKTSVQFLTLFYPGSKVIKNAYIITNKKFPPSFIMNRIYNFEKSGNVNDLLENKTE